MDKFDQRLEATGTLVDTGMKLIVRMNARIDVLTKGVDALTHTIDEIAKTRQLMLKLLQGDRNGHGRPGVI
jgi:hypothetical protein